MSDTNNSKNNSKQPQTDLPENVELQFDHTQNLSAEEEQAARQQTASDEAGEYKKEGLDRHDVGVEDTMVASDPPSTNMGGDDGAEHGKKKDTKAE